MAKVWKAKEGADPTSGGPWAVVPISNCEAKLHLKKSGFLKGPPRPEEAHAGPRFGNVNDAIAPFREPKFVVIELENDEANANGWHPGFYLAEISVTEAEQVLQASYQNGGSVA